MHAARCAFYAASGVVLFALTVTLAAIMWMKGLMDEWYSTMYGVCYFAASVWVTLPTVYVISADPAAHDGPARTWSRRRPIT